METLGLDVENASGKLTHVKGNPLAKDQGEPASGYFNYSSVVGMVMYIAGHTCPCITYTLVGKVQTTQNLSNTDANAQHIKTCQKWLKSSKL